ncbi:LysR family transcriptional regulator [Thaumasiovibrio sp. DFM-14]|uniref:LysR family transcriptional regulator n=1 Tax=Thaumasiovibrio sp. DFM-14 TaxID=3384792 RepID=UPI0039A21EFD
MFSYEHLLAFCTTYEEQGYSTAAKKLNKDRTTIRDQVKALEEAHQLTLFHIVGKKATPTAAAEHIYKQAKTVLAGTERLSSSLSSLYQDDLVSLNIYHDISLPLEMAVKIEHAVVHKFPEVRINWLHRNRSEAFSGVESCTNSIAIMQHRHKQATDQTMEFCSLGYGKLALYAGARSKLRHLNDLSMEDLQLARQYISENHFDTLPELFSISPIRHIVSNNDLLLTLVKHGGWAILSAELAQPYVMKGELFELEVKQVANQFAFGLSLFYPVTLEPHPIINCIKQIARQHFSV